MRNKNAASSGGKLGGIFDVAIIGGGINGCGIARDAAGRGLSVYLCEQADLASGTSSASTKLIHGGLRYLEYYEFRLVRESLQEREVLWRVAPHIVQPLRFVLPHHKGLRRPGCCASAFSSMTISAGASCCRRRGPSICAATGRQAAEAGDFTKAFEYSDCWVDDARLVVLNAVDAARRGADIRTRTRAVSAERRGDHWILTTEHVESGEREQVQARTLVNAAGPWVARTLSDVAKVETKARIRLVQGSHIVVPKLFDHDRCYIFQNTDGRIVFAIPYEQDFT
jgi:glycerol-3-phosphate dehydrogenase